MTSAGTPHFVEGFIYLAAGADPAADRFVREQGVSRSTFIAVPDGAAAVRAAVELANQGVHLIEVFGAIPVGPIVEAVNGRTPIGAELIVLCGGTSALATAQVVAAVGDQVPVGAVAWPFETVTGAAEYSARYEESFNTG